jgi:hypothetical protein
MRPKCGQQKSEVRCDLLVEKLDEIPSLPPPLLLSVEANKGFPIPFVAMETN